jgi:hypothetical protein
MGYLGSLSFQANDNTDLFFVADIVTSQFDQTDEELLAHSIDDLEGDPDWVTGILPKKTPVTVDGDTSTISCVYKATELNEFVITIYIEYEEVEQLVEVEEEDPEEKPKERFL